MLLPSALPLLLIFLAAAAPSLSRRGAASACSVFCNESAPADFGTLNKLVGSLFDELLSSEGHSQRGTQLEARRKFDLQLSLTDTVTGKETSINIQDVPLEIVSIGVGEGLENYICSEVAKVYEGSPKQLCIENIVPLVPLSLDVFCEAIVDNTSGLYMLSVAWEMPDGVGGSSSMDLIEQVVINTTIVHNETGVEDFLYSKTFSPTNKRYTLAGQDPLSEKNALYSFNVIPVLKALQGIQGELRGSSCTMNAPPIPPSAIKPIEAQLSYLGGRHIVTTVCWERPLFPAGTILQYELRIASYPSSPKQEEPECEKNCWEHFSTLLAAGETEAKVQPYSSYPENATELFFQMRSRNEYLWSDWSEATRVTIPTPHGPAGPNAEEEAGSTPLESSKIHTFPAYAVAIVLMTAMVAGLVTVSAACAVLHHCYYRGMKRKDRTPLLTFDVQSDKALFDMTEDFLDMSEEENLVVRKTVTEADAEK